MSEDSEFFFESEHLALKNNKDYLSLIKYISILESQRSKAIQDIDTLKNIETNILNDLDTFLKKLKNGEDLGIPSKQIIKEMPKIDWNSYLKYLPKEIQPSVDNLFNKTDLSQTFSSEELRDFNFHEEKKTENHNRLWTSEEQKRLEELLIEYPSEPIEMRRFAKIAKALGNRTTKQVCSRVQKYFIKLYKAGLPIPGRIPKTVDKKGSNHRHQRYNRYLYRPSTFFPDNEVPVHMSQFDDDVPGPSSYFTEFPKPVNKSFRIEENNMLKTEAIRKIDLLNKIKHDKELGFSFSVHLNYSCNYCKQEPIIGTRWHCTNCSSPLIDFCSACIVSQLDSEMPHPLSHQIVPVRFSDTKLTNKLLQEKDQLNERSVLVANNLLNNKSEQLNGGAYNLTESIKIEPYSTYDEDYYSQNFGESNELCYNYLDPNFLPE